MSLERPAANPELQSWKTRALLVGTVVGALIGAAGAYLLVQRAEAEQRPVPVTPGDGVKVGITVLGLLRQVMSLGD
jgi:hypothetical protein